jgi:hypothetical protein
MWIGSGLPTTLEEGELIAIPALFDIVCAHAYYLG